MERAPARPLSQIASEQVVTFGRGPLAGAETPARRMWLLDRAEMDETEPDVRTAPKCSTPPIGGHAPVGPFATLYESGAPY